MRGENKRPLTTGRIIDNEGNTQFHIVSAWWVNIIITGFVAISILFLILVGLILFNKYQIDTIQEQIKVDNSNVVNTSNSNR